MLIENAQYQNDRLTGQSNVLIKVTIHGKVMWVPVAPGNRHYAEIMRQVAAGTLTIADAD